MKGFSSGREKFQNLGEIFTPENLILVNLPVRVTRSVSALFWGFNSQLELSFWMISQAICTLADLAEKLADLAISLSFLRVANHVELFPEVKMEGRQNFLQKQKQKNE